MICGEEMETTGIDKAFKKIEGEASDRVEAGRGVCGPRKDISKTGVT